VDVAIKDENGCGGFMFDGSRVIGFAHKWSDERDTAKFDVRESTGYVEVLGAVFWFRQFGAFFEKKRLLLFLDNATAVQGIQAAYSKNTPINPLIAAARRIRAKHNITLSTRFLKSELNAIADHLSHLRVLEAHCSEKCLLSETHLSMTLNP